MKPTGRPGRNKASPRSAAPKKSAPQGGRRSVCRAIEHRARLLRLVGQLPETQRRVVHERFVDQRSIREIAERLGKSEGAVKQLPLRARAPACADGRRPCLSGCPSAPSPSRSKRLCKLCSCLCSRGRRKCRTATLHRLLRLPASCVTCREPSFEQHSNPICKGERLCP